MAIIPEELIHALDGRRFIVRCQHARSESDKEVYTCTVRPVEPEFPGQEEVIEVPLQRPHVPTVVIAPTLGETLGEWVKVSIDAGQLFPTDGTA
jgi:hypothetical protein